MAVFRYVFIQDCVFDMLKQSFKFMILILTIRGVLNNYIFTYLSETDNLTLGAILRIALILFDCLLINSINRVYLTLYQREQQNLILYALLRELWLGTLNQCTNNDD